MTPPRRTAPESSSHSYPAASNGLTLRVLGEVLPAWKGRPLGLTAPRLLSLLAYLHLQGPTPRQALACTFWPGRGAAHVRQALYTLRTLPGADEWLAHGSSVAVSAYSDLDEVWHHLGRQDYAPALALLWPRRPLLGGLFSGASTEFEEWLEGQQAALDRAHLNALLSYAHDLQGRGEREQAREYLRRTLEVDPLDERGYRALMTLEHAAGQMAEALEVFEACRVILKRELDTLPQPETLALLRHLELGIGATSGRHNRARVLTTADLPVLANGPLCGRREDLVAVTAQLGTHNRALLQGLPGIGKSRLAWAVVIQTLETAEAARVLWLELNADVPEVVLAALQEALGLQPSTTDAELAASLRHQQVRLIVLDNAASSYSLHSLLEHLPADMPVLVTSRQRLPQLPRVSLQRLARDDSVALMRGYLQSGPDGPDLPLPDAYTLDALCAVLGDHPYALRLAAVTLLQKGAPRARELLAALSVAPHGQRDGRSVAALIEQRVAALIEQSLALLDSPAYEAYLGLGSLFAPQTTPELLALALRRDADDTESALYTLMQHGLTARYIQPGSDTVVYRMHELTWNESCTHQALHPHMVLKAVGQFADHYSRNSDLLSHEVPNLLGAADLAQRQYPEELPALFYGWLNGPYIRNCGFPTTHLPLLAKAVQIAEQAGDWEQAGVLRERQGDIQHALLGDPHGAIAQYLKAAGYARQVGLWARQATVLAVAGELQAQLHLPESGATLQEAVDIARRSGDPLIHGRVLEKQGAAHVLRNDFRSARAALQASRELMRPLLTPQQPQLQEARTTLANVTSTLGQVYQQLHNLNMALVLKREARELARQGNDVLAAASRLAEIGEILSLMGRFEEARAALQEAIGHFRDLGVTAQESAACAVLNRVPEPE
ncbi:AfsR/SARP family transcriptional regulator [Deinococcus aerolatus]|uniref:AfsR/SARP family transcriptional regulator n=1 Tax=Deinococcus aerolatus TaxID=522487 RepID=UPI001669B5DA|nr:tetratricopeptide repeat protein [Deinococcus aerolatus]